MNFSPTQILFRHFTRKFCSKFIVQNANFHFCSSSEYRTFENFRQIAFSRSLVLSSRSQKSVTITFLKDDGTEVKRRARIGDTLQDLVAEDDAEISGYGVCGGVTACSTCHVIFPKEVFDKLEAATSEEEDLIDFAPDNCETSRLGCNVSITEEMDGVVVRVPSAKQDQRP